MPNFFKEFPLVRYRFGDNEFPVYFQNMSTYVDLLEEVKTQVAFYQKITIEEGERPDTLSYKLYGTSNYYWTFFMMNEHLKESGWPLNFQQLQTQIPIWYPHWSITTEDVMADIFPVGTILLKRN